MIFSSSSGGRPAPLPRRTFLRVAGASAASVGLVLAGCGDDPPAPAAPANILSFGSISPNPDVPVMNYLLFIKQLQFAFYDKVVKAFPADLTAAEQAHLRDLRDHELVQRQVLANVLRGAALPVAPFDFASLTLTTRAGVLAAAQTLEDTGAGAFLGIIERLNNGDLVALAARMASVEARHSALVRDLRAPGSFAGDEQNDQIVTSTGLQAGQAVARTPEQVKAVLAPFLPTLTISLDTLLQA